MASGHPDEGAPDHEEPGKRHVVLQDEGSVNNRPPTVRVRQSFAEGDSFVGDGSRDRMRTIHPYDAAANRRYDYPPNFLKTSHYTLLNFLPLNLLKQFVQFSNIYFFVVMVISLFPGISPITPASAVVPLIFVLTVAAVKDGYEDWKRHRADKHDNSALAKVLVGDRWQEVPSMDIQVGDFILLERGPGGEACPVKADVVLVSSADDDGVVYIETSQLDGETNVKPRKARIETQALGQEPEELANASPDLLYTVDHPNPKIYSWHGVLQHALDGNHAAAQKAPLAIKNVIWRGSSMKKTPWAVGLVIYTGRDTKQGRNLKRTIRKMSSLSVKVNKLITGIFIFKHLLLFPLCILSIVWSNEEGGSHWYLADIVNEYEDWEVFFLNYMTYFVLLSFLIPISLFVTVELCKVCQVMLMKYDHQMMHYMKGPGWVGCRPKTSDLNEQLAIVKYVFTDKTGTLTENIMRYVEGAVLASAPAAHEKSWLVHNEVRDPGSINSTTGPGSGAKGDAAGGFQGFPADLGPVSDVGRYLACMALCNAVVPFEDSRTGKVVFEGSSPDEVALVQAAASNHFLLSKRSSRDVCLKIGGGVTDENSSAAAKEHTFEILQDLEFTPTRKMMSVVVRDSEGTILLLTKGADSSVLANLSPAAKSDASLGPGQQLLSSFASKQFRTLCLAWRVVTEQEYDSWSIKFNDVQVSVGRTDEMVDAVCLQLESSLELIGFAAYEDKLQDGVPETIEFLTNSGIVVWMLTGDKLETGIEIGKTCGLAHGTEVVDVHLAREFADDQTLVDKKDDSQEDREARRKRREELCHEKIASASARADELASAKAGPRRITIAIDGPSIDILQSQKERILEVEFVALAHKIHSAICCRLTPSQKGYIVTLFQNRKGETALAIGDGANDATMISQALVGIGIIGLEGSQAELASDYAIPRFRFLQRLLAVHGRYALYRNARCVCFSFYKNIALSLCQVYFAGFSAFSGATVFDSWLLAIKNTLFSFLPPFLIGCFGKDISEEILMDPKLGPQLYSQLRDGLYFDGAAVSSWFGVALLHGTVIFWVMVDTLQQDDTDPGGGKTTGLIQTGTYMMSMVVYVVLTKAAVHMHIITAIQVCGLLFSYVLYPSTLAAYSAIPSAEYEGAYDLLQDTAFYGLSQSLFSDPKHYLYIFISVIGLVSTFDFSILYLQRKIRPTLRDECADNYDYQDPPWNRSLPIFGCCGRSTAGVHPLSPLDRGRFEGLDVTPSGRGFGPSRHGDEDPNPFSVPNCSRSLSASSSSNLLASEPNLQTTPPGRSHERNMWPRTPPAIPNFKPLSSSITGVFTSNGTGGYKTGLPLHFGLPLVPATPPTNTPLSSTPPPTRPGSGSSSIIAAGPGSAAAMPHDASAIPPYRPPPAPFTRSVTSETYIPGRLRIKPLPTLRQADFSSLSPPVTPPPMLPRSQPVPPLGVRR